MDYDKKMEFRRLTVDELITHPDFKSLTIKDLLEIYKCQIVSDRQTGHLKIKIRCQRGHHRDFTDNHIDLRKRFKKKLEMNTPYPDEYIPYCLGTPLENVDHQFSKPTIITENTEMNNNEDTKEKSSDNTNEPSNYDLMQEYSHDIINRYYGAIGIENDEKTNNSSEKIKIPKFKDLTIESLKEILDLYYSDEISLDDIRNVWHVGDIIKISSDNGGRLSFRIIDFNHDRLSIPINNHDKALLTLSVPLNEHYDGSFDIEFIFDTFITKWMPQRLANLIKVVMKKDPNLLAYVNYVNAKCFPFNTHEIFGQNLYVFNSDINVSNDEQYKFFAYTRNNIQCDNSVIYSQLSNPIFLIKDIDNIFNSIPPYYIATDGNRIFKIDDGIKECIKYYSVIIGVCL